MNIWSSLPAIGTIACEVILSDNDFLYWVNQTSVDLVILNAGVNECVYGMVYLWKSKLILYSSSTAFGWYLDSYGLPDETSWIPDMMLAYPPDMTFFQRLKNYLLPIAWHIYRRQNYLPYLEQLSRTKLQLPASANFEEIEQNTSMVFINTHYGEEFARSLPPNIVALGGMAWTETRKPLPKELDEFLERGSAFIYVSFGTCAKFTRMDRETQDAMIGAFKSFPNIQFVWKVENATLIEEFPDRNVYVGQWMPQHDVLAHPKIKAFITHSGTGGVQEAVLNAVPLVSFPIVGDQDYNAERIHRREYGIRLEITTVAQSQLQDAINCVLTNPKYANNMKKVSKMFQDRSQNSLETAMWWTNYVLRHSPDELEALRPLSVGQPWWKKRQLDIWLLVATIAAGILSLFVVVIYIMIKCCICTTYNSKQKTSSKRKME